MVRAQRERERGRERERESANVTMGSTTRKKISIDDFLLSDGHAVKYSQR